MKAVTLIGDPGSCHMGKLEYAKELIDVAIEAGLDAVKFQLLGEAEIARGNIKLPWDWLLELRSYGMDGGMEVFASVFSADGLTFLLEHAFSTVKIPYGKRRMLWEATVQEQLAFRKIYVSTDIMTALPPLPGVKTLYCIAEYPVRYQIDWEGIFPQFDGFSSHCLGIAQDIRAVEAGAMIIEKHFTLDRNDIDCPDYRFALTPKNLKRLVEGVGRG